MVSREYRSVWKKNSHTTDQLIILSRISIVEKFKTPRNFFFFSQSSRDFKRPFVFVAHTKCQILRNERKKKIVSNTCDLLTGRRKFTFFFFKKINRAIFDFTTIYVPFFFSREVNSPEKNIVKVDGK